MCDQVKVVVIDSDRTVWEAVGKRLEMLDCTWSGFLSVRDSVDDLKAIDYDVVLVDVSAEDLTTLGAVCKLKGTRLVVMSGANDPIELFASAVYDACWRKDELESLTRKLLTGE